MQKLSPGWITEKLIDFEYKKYILLAYLQGVSKDFEKTHLYPSLSDLVEHYRNVISLKENKVALYGNFPERLSSTDVEKFHLVFRKIVEDDALMQEIESIIDFSIPEFEKHLEEGRKVYEFIEEQIFIHPIGVLPLNPMEGYLMVRNGDSPETNVYEYQVSMIEHPTDRYRGIYTNHVINYKRSLSNTFESIRGELIRFNKDIPNPATYAIESDMTFPLTETLIPVAKRSFMRYLSETFKA